MSFEVIISDVAIQEAQDAYEYYEDKQIGLGDRFKEILETEIESIIKNPTYNRKIKNQIRQCLLHKFPFVIVYELMPEVIVIYSIFHTSRNPKKKFKP